MICESNDVCVNHFAKPCTLNTTHLYNHDPICTNTYVRTCKYLSHTSGTSLCPQSEPSQNSTVGSLESFGAPSDVCLHAVKKTTQQLMHTRASSPVHQLTLKIPTRGGQSLPCHARTTPKPSPILPNIQKCTCHNRHMTHC